jgi:hypothetical protein
MINYDSADTERTFRDPSKLQGVYKKADDPRSGISSADNLARWSGYAGMNSFDGKDGKDPAMPDRAAGVTKAPTVIWQAHEVGRRINTARIRGRGGSRKPIRGNNLGAQAIWQAT